MIPAEILISTTQGRRVFPVAAGSKTPLVKWRSEDPASSDLDQVNRWFIRWGATNWGLATGVDSGVFVVDTDTKQGYDWAVANGLTDTYSVKTGGNTPEKLSYGYHFYFKHPGAGTVIKNSAKDLSPGVDIRGDGGYVLMPPSVTEMPYYVANQREIAPAPAWLLAAVTKSPEEQRTAATGTLSAQDIEHGRNIYHKACREYPNTPDGRWNIELNNLAGLAGRMVAAGVLSDEEAWNIATEFGAAYIQNNPSAFSATWRSGFKWGLGSPWAPLSPEDVGFAGGVPSPPSSDLTTSLEVYNMSNISWLWPGWLPMGKLVLYAGPGGVGKSTVAFSWAATISRGGKWPDGMPCPKGKVLIWSGEDDVADTIKPRLMSMGADDKQIEIITGSDGAPFDPAHDFPKLKLRHKKGDISLVIIDPIVSAVSGDGHKNSDVRRGLQAIVNFGIDLNCCMIGITHFNKGGAGKNPTERVTDSQAYTAMSRMTIVSQKDKETGECVIARSKSNNTVDTGGFKYRIEPITYQGIDTTRIAWLEGVEGTAQSLIDELEPSDEKVSERKVDSAMEYLKLALSTQDLPLKQLTEQGGFSKNTLMRAKGQLPIRIVRDGNKQLWHLIIGSPKPE